MKKTFELDGLNKYVSIVRVKRIDIAESMLTI